MSGKLRNSSASDFSCHHPARCFPAEFKLSYSYAVRLPFPARAILLQSEMEGDGCVHFCGQLRGVDVLVYCSTSVD